VQHANATSSLTLTTTRTNIPGASLTLNRAGRYLITGNFTFLQGDPGFGLRGDLLAGGVQLGGGTFVAAFDNNSYLGTSQQWVYQAATPSVVVALQAFKDGGTGGSATAAGSTSITAQWISP
jgi:hypothetical protein